jgi:hypothetical protein
MTNQIEIWEVDGSLSDAKLLDSTNQVETEDSLEEMLVGNPDMLSPGLTLVGRQTPVDNGNLDLLGVDEHGRLIVFELKRAKLTRKAVAQVIDYCSYLESLAEGQLAAFIADNSGKNGIEEIDDFNAWYNARYGSSFDSFRPTQMVLVGLGADAQAQRMVEFLAASGVDISLLTFQGYLSGDRLLLARQGEQRVEAITAVSGRRQLQEHFHKLSARARELGFEALWRDVVDTLTVDAAPEPTKYGITFYEPMITLPENANVKGSHSVVIDRKGRIRVTFYPGAVHLCLEDFENVRQEMLFKFERPPNAPTTKAVAEQWYCWLDQHEWESHKETLSALAHKVHQKWQRIRRGGAEFSSKDVKSAGESEP